MYEHLGVSRAPGYDLLKQTVSAFRARWSHQSVIHRGAVQLEAP